MASELLLLHSSSKSCSRKTLCLFEVIGLTMTPTVDQISDNLMPAIFLATSNSLVFPRSSISIRGQTASGVQSTPCVRLCERPHTAMVKPAGICCEYIGASHTQVTPYCAGTNHTRNTKIVYFLQWSRRHRHDFFQIQ